MKAYEAFVIFLPQHAGEALDKAKNLIQEAVKKHGGKANQASDLGRRPLGYSVKKTKEGQVVCFDFEMAASELSGFTKTLQLTEEIAKFMVTAKPHIPRPKKIRVRKPRHVRPAAQQTTTSVPGTAKP